MSAIDGFFEKYDSDGKTKLDFNEFLEFYNRKAHSSYACTIPQEDEAKDITKCSTVVDCFDKATNKYDNSKCPGRESCASVVADSW